MTLIFTESPYYYQNLQGFYDNIKEHEHLGVADKFLIRLNFDRAVKYSLLSDIVDIKNMIKIDSHCQMPPLRELLDSTICLARKSMDNADGLRIYF